MGFYHIKYSYQWFDIFNKKRINFSPINYLMTLPSIIHHLVPEFLLSLLWVQKMPSLNLNLIIHLNPNFGQLIKAIIPMFIIIMIIIFTQNPKFEFIYFIKFKNS